MGRIAQSLELSLVGTVVDRLSGMCKAGTHDGCDTYGIVRLPHGKTMKCTCPCHAKPLVRTKTLQERA